MALSKGPIERALVKVQDGVAAAFVQRTYTQRYARKPTAHCMFGWVGEVLDLRHSWDREVGVEVDGCAARESDVGQFLNEFFDDYWPEHTDGLEVLKGNHWSQRYSPHSAEEFSDRAPNKDEVIWFLDEAIDAAHAMGV